jgi:hypothetical protein
VFGHPALPFGGTAQRIDDGGEFNEQAVSGSFDDPAVMFRDLRIDKSRLIALSRSRVPSSSAPMSRE